MNFFCSSVAGASPFIGAEKHCHKEWTIYLDKGWTKQEGFFHKGGSASWCKIYFDPFIKIETNKYRDFPLFYDKHNISNCIKLDNAVPVDGNIQADPVIEVQYDKNFYPRLARDHLTFKESHEILFDCLVENVGIFSHNNNRQIFMPKQNGLDTLTVRSVFDYLGVDYKLFEITREDYSKVSHVGKILAKDHWGFTQIMEIKDSVIASGFYGDEWVLRNPYYVNALLQHRGIDLTKHFDSVGECYMQKWFDQYRSKLAKNGKMSLEQLLQHICNDFQIWHLNTTSFISPLKHPDLLRLLSADNETILGQITNGDLSKSIIEKCNPALLDLLDQSKNSDDPDWFG